MGSRSPLLSRKGRSTPVEAERTKVLGIVKSSKKRLPTACPLGEAEVVEVRRVDRFEIDRVLRGRLDEDSKKTQLNLRRLEQDNGLLPKTRSKSSRKDTQKYVPFSSFVGIMSEMALRNGER